MALEKNGRVKHAVPTARV